MPNTFFQGEKHFAGGAPPLTGLSKCTRGQL